MITVVMGVYNVPDRGRPAERVEGGQKGVAVLDEPVDENGAFRGHKNPLISLSARADLTVGILADLYEASDIRVYRHSSSLPAFCPGGTSMRVSTSPDGKQFTSAIRFLTR
jgi:hypothetical protein